MHSRLATAAAARVPAARGFHNSGAAQAKKKTIVQLAKEMPLKGQSVFVRADLNVPVKNGAVKDTTRIVLSAPTIRFLLDQGAKVRTDSTGSDSVGSRRLDWVGLGWGTIDPPESLKWGTRRGFELTPLTPPTEWFIHHFPSDVCAFITQVVVSSHLGRPKGQVLEDKRLTPVVPVLSEAVKAPVKLAPDSAGPEAAAFVKNAKPGEVVLLENTRFHAGETKNDEKYSKQVRSCFLVLGEGGAARAASSAHALAPNLRGRCLAHSLIYYLPSTYTYMYTRTSNHDHAHNSCRRCRARRST
jgi:hypothetical protein